MGVKDPIRNAAWRDYYVDLRNEKDGINVAMVTLMRNMLCEIYLGVICF